MASWDKEVFPSSGLFGKHEGKDCHIQSKWKGIHLVGALQASKEDKWKQFKKYFKQKYLSNRYYDDKIKEFHELRLGQQTMEEYADRFLELLRYVRYIEDEKVKVQHFLSGLSQSYKDRIEFYESRTLEEAIRKAKYCYEQRKEKHDYHKTWKHKKNEKSDQRKKGSKPYHFRNQ